MLAELDALIVKYRERYGEGKPYQILLAVRGVYEGGKIPNRIQRGRIIRTVWRHEIKQIKSALQDARVQLLSNTFSAHKKTLNQRLRQLAEAGENPLRLGLVRGEGFGVLEDPDIRAKSGSPSSSSLARDGPASRSSSRPSAPIASTRPCAVAPLGRTKASPADSRRSQTPSSRVRRRMAGRR